MPASDSKKAASPGNGAQSRPRRARIFFVAAALLLGAAVGLGLFTFDYAQGTSYFSSESQTCANCHIMQEHYDAWVKSTHARVAKCNDCHAPHNFVGKWYCKSRNGYFHSKAFTLQDYPGTLIITDYNRQVVEDSCRHCHSDVTHTIDLSVGSDGERLSCIRCHSEVGHPN